MVSRWIVSGSLGQLGRALTASLEADAERSLLAAADLPELDVADVGSVASWLAGLDPPPDVLVNAAAYTHVDRCEREPETAWRNNAEAPGVLAAACRDAGIRLVHVSTDYVFAGDRERPYTEDDPPDPRSCYGRTKLEGERRVLAACGDSLLVRTSWVYGHGRNFLAAILAQAGERRAGRASVLRVVDDQRGRPTYAVDLAEAILALLDRDARGLYHVANEGVATWWDLARACLDESGFPEIEVERIRSTDLQLDAPRPAFSVLDCSKAAAAGVKLRPWREALRAYLHSNHSPLRAAPAAGN
jgi:dTDP-4-dehydrorhamnose reductase